MKTLVWDGPNAMHVEDGAGTGRSRPGRADPQARGGRDLRLGGRGLPRPHGQPDPAAGHGPRVRGDRRGDRRRRGRAGRRARRGQPADAAAASAGCADPASRTCARTACWSACTSRARSPGFVKVRAADARVLPDGVSARVGALMEPLANGVHAVRLAPPGVESAVVLGAGTIGLMTVQAALLDGILHVAVDRAAGRAPRAGRRARRPRRLRVARGGQGRGRAGPRARRRRRAGHPRAGAGAAAARRDARLHRAGRRRHHARLPRRDPQPAPHPGLLRVHDGRLRAGPRVVGERSGDARQGPARGAAAGGRAGAVRAPGRRPAAARVQGLPGAVSEPGPRQRGTARPVSGIPGVAP